MQKPHHQVSSLCKSTGTATMKLILLMSAFVLVASVDVTLEEWEAYKKQYNKTYNIIEDKARYNQYLSRKFIIEEHNSGSSSYLMGVNYFTDLFPEELKHLLLPRFQDTHVQEMPYRSVARGNAPDSINWVEKGAVTDVKDQKNCSASYAFSAAGALEGLMYKQGQTVRDISVQELLDCDMKNYGCTGGWPQQSFDYVSRKQGIDTDKSYPYVGKSGKCLASDGTNATICTGYQDIDDENALMEAVGTIGPVSILFSVNIDNFFLYKSGIYDDVCGDHLNHAMLAVGYDRDEIVGKDYWLIKNSWSDDWGEKGYVKVVRSVNKCQLGDKASIPVIRTG